MTTGAGIFFDGRTSARHDVTVELDASGLRIVGAGGHTLAQWAYRDLDSHSAEGQMLRLGRKGDRTLARLEIPDAAFAAEIDARAAGIDRSGASERRQRGRVVAWSVAAVVSLLLVGYYGVPALSDRIAPLVPQSVERRLGNAVDAQVRGMLDTKNLGDKFECGNAESERAGRTALAHLIGRLEQAAALPLPLRAAVVRRNEANAIALPGTQIYVFEGLIAKATTPDEVAGVIAHEIGHIVHRDGTKSVLQAAGLSLLFGMLLGDFVGGGAVVVAARAALQSSYSREAEAAADLYGAKLMAMAGGDGRALGTILTRLGGATEPGMKILLDHPETKSRVAAINKAVPARTTAPFLDPAEWAALKRICSGA